MEKEIIIVRYKFVTWSSVRFKCTPEQKEALIKDLEETKGDVDSVTDEELYGFEEELHPNDGNYMTLKENGGKPTVLVYDEINKVIWDNKTSNMNFKTTFDSKPFNVDNGIFGNKPVLTIKKAEEGKKLCIQFNKAALQLLGYRVYKDNTKVAITLGDDDNWYVVKSDLGGDVTCSLYQDGTVKNANMVKQMWAYMGLDESVDNSFELKLQEDDEQVYAKLVKIN